MKLRLQSRPRDHLVWACGCQRLFLIIVWSAQRTADWVRWHSDPILVCQPKLISMLWEKGLLTFHALCTGVMLTQISAYTMHKNIAVCKIMELMHFFRLSISTWLATAWVCFYHTTVVSLMTTDSLFPCCPATTVWFTCSSLAQKWEITVTLPITFKVTTG